MTVLYVFFTHHCVVFRLTFLRLFVLGLIVWIVSVSSIPSCHFVQPNARATFCQYSASLTIAYLVLLYNLNALSSGTLVNADVVLPITSAAGFCKLNGCDFILLSHIICVTIL